MSWTGNIRPRTALEIVSSCWLVGGETLELPLYDSPILIADKSALPL
ncbi:MAG: hypothetical protein K8R57_04660 [Verrucomicrobia bacterium]|nr:hypothetical protein [Verrucomicrobiota bacterium]